VLEIIIPIVPYVDMPISLNKKLPIKEPTTPVARSPQRPKPPPREILPANQPEINPMNKNHSIFISPPNHIIPIQLILIKDVAGKSKFRCDI